MVPLVLHLDLKICDVWRLEESSSRSTLLVQSRDEQIWAAHFRVASSQRHDRNPHLVFFHPFCAFLRRRMCCFFAVG